MAYRAVILALYRNLAQQHWAAKCPLARADIPSHLRRGVRVKGLEIHLVGI